MRCIVRESEEKVRMENGNKKWVEEKSETNVERKEGSPGVRRRGEEARGIGTEEGSVRVSVVAAHA